MDVVDVPAWQVVLAVLRVLVPMLLAVLIAISLRTTARNYRMIAAELASWRAATPGGSRSAPDASSDLNE